jgi:PAS domain-containing protein
MIRVCAWCNNEIGSQQGETHSGRRINQSLCQQCSENFVFQMGVPLQKLLDTLPAPIFVIDAEGRVQGANAQGYHLLKKDRVQVQGRLRGVVFECAYARLPEGCGRTIHCSGCAIRRAVYQTFETGQTLEHLPATLRCGNLDQPDEIDLLISTEKMGNVVLLRIDDIKNMPVPS